MAKAVKLPSGNYRARVYFMQDGIRKSESFTATKPKEAELLAAQFELKLKNASKASCDMTVGEAIDRYIASKSRLLSPTTIREYKSERKKRLQGLMDIKLIHLTQEQVQRAINDDAAHCGIKTLRNVHGLLSAALSMYHKDFKLATDFAIEMPRQMEIPENEDIQMLMKLCAGSQLETAILFGATLGMRRSEICALTWDDINFEKMTVRINKALVLNEEKKWELKGTKTASSTRTLKMSQLLADHLKGLPRKNISILTVNPDALTNRFCKLRTKCGFKFRFHDLRHYNASIMLAKNVPDKYAMAQLGHSTPNMLKTVYQHLMNDKREEVAATVNNFMDETFGKQ